MKTAIISGASGLVGHYLLIELLDSPLYEKVYSVVRRAENIKHPKLVERIIDFNRVKESLHGLEANHVFCCLGTTLKKAGSKVAQYKIDHDYVVNYAKACLETKSSEIVVVSSIGANVKSNNFYLKTKGDVETDISSLAYKGIHFMRPSFLLGDREEFRLGEKAGVFIARLFSPLLIGDFKKYRGIEAKTVAKAMVAAANSEKSGIHNYLYDDMIKLAETVIREQETV